jgi:hypothetical protein
MKNILNIGIIIVTIGLVATVFIGARNIGYKKAESKYESMIDSINAIAASIPDTVTLYDTIRPDPVIRWRDPKTPEPVKIDFVKNFYADSLVNTQVAIYIQDTISGLLLNRQIGFKLFVPLEVSKTITVTEKVPVIVKEPYQRQAELYGGMLVPYNNGKIGFGLSADLVTKKQKIFGIQYMTISDKNILVGKIGFKF